MGHFSTEMKARAWMVTVQVSNFKSMGLQKEFYDLPEQLAPYLSKLWDNSGKERSSAVSVCVSEKGLYHAHMALYGNTTTLKNVAKILHGAHVEPQMGGKKELEAYMLKKAPYEEKGEQVLHSLGIEKIRDNKGKRSDVELIEEMLERGCTLNEIMSESFSFRKYEQMIRNDFIARRIKNTPLIKETHNEWHVGASGTGKTYVYVQLTEKYGIDNVYLATDFENG